MKPPSTANMNRISISSAVTFSNAVTDISIVISKAYSPSFLPASRSTRETRSTLRTLDS